MKRASLQLVGDLVSPADLRASLMLRDAKLDRVVAAPLARKENDEPVTTTARVAVAGRGRVGRDLSLGDFGPDDGRSIFATIERNDPLMVQEFRTAARADEQRGVGAPIRIRLDLIRRLESRFHA